MISCLTQIKSIFYNTSIATVVERDDKENLNSISTFRTNYLTI